MLSISCKGATNKLPCQFDAANIVALIRNNICDEIATIFATKSQQYFQLRLEKKRKFVLKTLCFAGVDIHGIVCNAQAIFCKVKVSFAHTGEAALHKQ